MCPTSWTLHIYILYVLQSKRSLTLYQVIEITRLPLSNTAAAVTISPTRPTAAVPLRLPAVTHRNTGAIIAAPRRRPLLPRSQPMRRHRINRRSRPAGCRSTTSNTSGGITLSRRPAARSGKPRVTILPEGIEDGARTGILTIRLTERRGMGIPMNPRTATASMVAMDMDTAITATATRAKATASTGVRKRRRRRTIAAC